LECPPIAGLKGNALTCGPIVEAANNVAWAETVGHDCCALCPKSYHRCNSLRSYSSTMLLRMNT